MSGESSIAKIFIILGIMFVLVGLLYPGADSGWNNLRTTLSTGIDFPEFVNPFETDTVKDYDVIGNGAILAGGIWYPDPPSSTYNNASVPNCTGLTNWYGCVQTADGSGSYVRISSTTDSQFSVNMSQTFGGGNQYIVSSIVAMYECRAWTGTSGTIDFMLYYASNSTLHFDIQPTPCSSTGFQNYSFKNDLAFVEFVGSFSLQTLKFVVSAVNVDVSYVHFQIIYQHRQFCGGGLDGLVCSFQNFGQLVGDIVRYFINGIIFVVQSIVAIALFLGSAIFAFGIGIVTTMAFFIAIPDAPPIIQGIVAAMFIAMIALMLFLVAKLVRGSGPI